MSKGNKRFGALKLVLIVVVLLLAGIVALPFIVDANQFRPQIESKLSSALGRQVGTGNIKLSLWSGSVVVEDISIQDDPAFSRIPFVTAKSLAVGVELEPLMVSRVVRITGISLLNPSITLIRSASGRWNFSNLGSGASPAKPEAPGGQAGGTAALDVSIGQLKIVGGKITLQEADRKKASVYDHVDLTVSNLSLASDFPFTLGATLPGGGTLKLSGKAGPVNRSDVSQTPFSADIAVARFDLVASGFAPPGSGLAGLFDFSGSVRSDGRQVESKGTAVASRLQVVRQGSPAGKPVSLQYAVRHDLQSQSGSVGDVSVGYGKAVAHLRGSYAVRGDSFGVKMQLRGSGLPVGDLSALFPAFGITLPKGASLQGGVVNVDLSTEGELDKLVTAGSADVEDTRLVGFDLSGKMSELAKVAGIKPSPETEISKFASEIRMTPAGLDVPSVELDVPSLGNLSGQGKIGTDQSLDFTMKALLKPSGGIGGGLAKLSRAGTLELPFFVRGTASEPKFVPDVKHAASSLLGSALPGKGSGTEGQSDSGQAIGDTLRGLLGKKK